MAHSNSDHAHAPSCYAATANSRTTYPTLEGDVTADVCIVGAGFTGISTALTLAERGYSVAVVEANRVGWGASGRNGGQMINGITGLETLEKKYGRSASEAIWQIRWRGHALIRERVQKYTIDCDLKDGFAEVAVKPAQLRDIDEAFEELEQRRFPHRYERWDREQTRSMFGTDAFHGAFVSYYDGHLHPLNLCTGEARAADGLGVRIYEQSPVLDIRHAKKPVVCSASGSVSADAVLIAGNAYSRLEPKQLSGLVYPAGSYIIATEPLSPDVAESIDREDLAVCDLNTVVDYFRLSADRRLLYGGACNYSGRDPSDIEAYIRPRMVKTYPQLADVRVEYQWGGKIGIVLNRVLSVGCLNGNVYYCQGYCGHGVSASHAMGEVMADAIGGSLERYHLFARMKHLRLPGSRWFGNQVIALGMLYYKLRDAL